MYDDPEDVESLRLLQTKGGMKVRGASKGPLFEYPAIVRWDGPSLDSDIVVVDFETTGLSARHDRIIEIAMARLNPEGELVAEFATVVDPGHQSLGAAHIHGITSADLVGAPAFEDVYDTLCDFLDGAVVVAHNATFEEWFLGHECLRARLPLPRNHAIDSLWLSHLLTNRPGHSVADMAVHTGFEQYKPHHAIGDVYATLDIIQPILRRRPHFVWRTRMPHESRVPTVTCELRPR
ncbi:MAG: 3'-5' exonuclease [Vicinamibacterales bacterium]